MKTKKRWDRITACILLVTTIVWYATIFLTGNDITIDMIQLISLIAFICVKAYYKVKHPNLKIQLFEFIADMLNLN